MQIVTKVELFAKMLDLYKKRCDILLDKERDDMKKRAIYISILCTVMLTACGNVSESTKRAETSDVSQTTTTLTTSAATAKEEKGYKRNRYYDKEFAEGIRDFKTDRYHSNYDQKIRSVRLFGKFQSGTEQFCTE